MENRPLPVGERKSLARKLAGKFEMKVSDMEELRDCDLVAMAAALDKGPNAEYVSGEDMSEMFPMSR